jgi:hypothetical protein
MSSKFKAGDKAYWFNGTKQVPCEVVGPYPHLITGMLCLVVKEERLGVTVVYERDLFLFEEPTDYEDGTWI